MIDFTDKIDEVVTSTFINAQRVAYQTLLNDIEAHNYTTIGEIKGAIHIELDSLERVRNKEEARQYEVDARADYNSEEQFNEL